MVGEHQMWFLVTLRKFPSTVPIAHYFLSVPTYNKCSMPAPTSSAPAAHPVHP